jgi:hypothetical protein
MNPPVARAKASHGRAVNVAVERKLKICHGTHALRSDCDDNVAGDEAAHRGKW